jgi:hypothetical protein
MLDDSRDESCKEEGEKEEVYVIAGPADNLSSLLLEQ